MPQPAVSVPTNAHRVSALIVDMRPAPEPQGWLNHMNWDRALAPERQPTWSELLDQPLESLEMRLVEPDN